MRTDRTLELDTVVLLISERHAGEELRARWRATSKSVSGSAFGELTLSLEPEVVSPIEQMRRPEPAYGERDEVDVDDEAG